MKSEKEYTNAEKRYMQEIIACTCDCKLGDKYKLYITTENKEQNFYECGDDPQYIQHTGSPEKLWLSDSSRMQVNKALDRFKIYMKEVLNGRFIKVSVVEDQTILYYRHLSKDRFDCVLDNKRDKFVVGNPRKITLFENSKLKWALHELDCWFEPYKALSGGEDNPIYLSAVEHGDEVMKSLIRLHYNFDDDSDLELLSKEVYGTYVLPRLSKEFNKFFSVDPASITSIPIGYMYLHKPWFAMGGNTHHIHQFNPHTRIAVDAAPVNSNVLSFEEYLDLFRKNGYVIDF